MLSATVAYVPYYVSLIMVPIISHTSNNIFLPTEHISAVKFLIGYEKNIIKLGKKKRTGSFKLLQILQVQLICRKFSSLEIFLFLLGLHQSSANLS